MVTIFCLIKTVTSKNASEHKTGLMKKELSIQGVA